MGRVKPPYADYVKFCMKFYSRNRDLPRFHNMVERNNWYACHRVLETYSPQDREILIYVYGAFDTLADNVYVMATVHHLDQNMIWDMMKEFERKVAVERGMCV